MEHFGMWWFVLGLITFNILCYIDDSPESVAKYFLFALGGLVFPLTLLYIVGHKLSGGRGI